MTSLSAVVGLDKNTLTPSICFSSHGTADAGTGYYEAAVETGGILFSICEEDWSGLLAELGFEASGLRKEFYLSKIPVQDTISVTVDGVEETRWTYISASNAIRFDDDAVPEEGAEIIVEYIIRENY
jgi:hypothetical protein